MATKLVKKSVGSFANEPSHIDVADETFQVAGKTFKMKRALTLPSLPWAEGEEKFFTILKKIEVSSRMSASEENMPRDPKKKKDGTEEERQLPPAHITQIRNLVDGGLYTLVVNSALERILNEGYPEDGYVDRSFRARKLAKMKAKRSGFSFNPFSVQEIDVPEI